MPNNAIDRDRWEWMQQYRVWEANRKVFLYPENWIMFRAARRQEPLLQGAESELLQKDINTQTVQDALKNYLIKVDEVGNLKVVGLLAEQVSTRTERQRRTQMATPSTANCMSLVSTRNAPYFFYYRYFNVNEKNWYPWEKVQVIFRATTIEGWRQIHRSWRLPYPCCLEQSAAYLLSAVREEDCA